MSQKGPPCIELVEANGPGDHPWKANANRSPTHLGYAVNNLAAASDALAAAGWRRVATVDSPSGSALFFAYHEGPGGMTIELVGRRVVPVPGVCDTPDSGFCPPSP